MQQLDLFEGTNYFQKGEVKGHSSRINADNKRLRGNSTSSARAFRFEYSLLAAGLSGCKTWPSRTTTEDG